MPKKLTKSLSWEVRFVFKYTSIIKCSIAVEMEKNTFINFNFLHIFNGRRPVHLNHLFCNIFNDRHIFTGLIKI